MRFIVIALVCVLATMQSALAQDPTRAEDVVIETLSRRAVFVAPELAGTVDEQHLQRVANDLRPFTVKFVVVPLRDRQFRSTWASRLRRYLNIREGAVIVLVPQAQGLAGGVSASSDVVSSEEITRIVEANMAVFSSQGYTQGLEQLAGAMREHVVKRERSEALNLGMLIGIPALLVVGGVAWVVRRRAQEVALLKERLQGLRVQVLDGIEYLDGYIDVLPEGEDASRAREHRQHAAELQTQALALMEKAKRPEDLWRAEHLLERAQKSVEKAKKYILRASGDLSVQVEEEPDELPTEEDGLAIRPNDRTYACFFCSKPPTLDQLQPVELTVGEQTRKVWACQQCAAELRRGETPSVRVFRDGDNVRPWYEAPDYDPYRDYGRATPGMDWVSLLLLGSILWPPTPVVIQQDEPTTGASDVPLADVGGADWLSTESTSAPQPDAGGADWLDTGTLADNSDAGGTDFFGSIFGSSGFGDADAGGADFGDFGDFGGGDAGGGDF